MTSGRRKVVAVAALVGLFLSLYLLLYALGYYGGLVCGAGSCEVVQMSRWARFLGLPVAAWGVGWYLAVFGVAVAWLQPDLEEARWPGRALAALAFVGVAFTAWLTYAEIVLIGAICRWCVASALLVLTIAGATFLPVRSGGGAPEPFEGRTVR